jgi:hypothetical protein
MYLLYLDDSGSVPNKNEQYFVLGGVCVFERRIHWITEKLNNIAEKIYPEKPDVIEFHASEIFSGRNAPWNSISNRNERINIIKEVLKVLDAEHESSVVFACAIHKPSFPNQDPMMLAFEDLISRFEMLLQRKYKVENNPQKGLIIFDKSAYETIIQSLSLTFRQIGTRWRNIKNINEVPLFVDSKASRLIQLADHIAYSVFRRYEAGDLNYFNCSEGRFDSEGGKIHGLVHKQNHNPNCTCPACITRGI